VVAQNLVGEKGTAALDRRIGIGLPQEASFRHSIQFAWNEGKHQEVGMAGSAAKVVISERQQGVLQLLSTARTVAQYLVNRATILLLAFQGLDNQAIAAQVSLGRHQVGLWRRRWQDAFPKLLRIECTDEPLALRRAIEDVLSDEQRSGSPGKFTGEQLALLLALACEPPEKSCRPITHWTGAELAQEAMQRGIVDSISPAQVNRYLREAQLQPHKSRY